LQDNILHFIRTSSALSAMAATTADLEEIAATRPAVFVEQPGPNGPAAESPG
jgi:hypothetical protein